MTDLRARMREAGASFKVTKNRLARSRSKGTKFEPLTDLFTGPTAIAYSRRSGGGRAKSRSKFAEEQRQARDPRRRARRAGSGRDGVKSLAKLPSLDELRAKLVGMIQTPATRLAGVTAGAGGPARPRACGARAEQGEAA